MVPSNSTCNMSHTSLVDSVAKMLLNCVGLTPLKMALRAFQLLDDYLSSSVVQSSSLLSTSLPDSSFSVGGVRQDCFPVEFIHRLDECMHVSFPTPKVGLSNKGG